MSELSLSISIANNNSGLINRRIVFTFKTLKGTKHQISHISEEFKQEKVA